MFPNLLAHSSLRLRLGFLLTMVRVYKLYLLTDYLITERVCKQTPWTNNRSRFKSKTGREIEHFRFCYWQAPSKIGRPTENP